MQISSVKVANELSGACGAKFECDNINIFGPLQGVEVGPVGMAGPLPAPVGTYWPLGDSRWSPKDFGRFFLGGGANTKSHKGSLHPAGAVVKSGQTCRAGRLIGIGSSWKATPSDPVSGQ